MKKKRGEDFERLTRKSGDKALELGRKKKREIVNKARDSESLEEIKEYIFEETGYENSPHQRYFG